MARWQQCNILQTGANARRIWQFDARKKDLALAREQAVPGNQPWPAGLVGKSWSRLLSCHNQSPVDIQHLHRFPWP